MQKNKQLIAACGLDCGNCDIRLIPFDPEAAQRAVVWFKKMSWLQENEGFAEVIQRKMYCNGCHGDRSIHWAPDCWILKCCVDEKGLDFCSQCPDFPCQRLQDWAREKTDYAAAFENLKKMRLEAP